MEPDDVYTKATLKGYIMGLLDEVYKPEALVYKRVLKGLDKLSRKELDSLWTLLMSSVVK